MKTIKTLIMIGALMIMLGMMIQTIEYQNEISNKDQRIVKLEKKINQITLENNKLKEENESLWNNYYENVSDYKGEYEYYE